MWSGEFVELWSVITVEECPCCGAREFEAWTEATDFRGSNETFGIARCRRCGLGATRPRPNDADLGRYYPKGNYVSHQNKAQSLFDRVYFEVQKRNLAFKNRVVSAKVRTGRLLDYGCGAGSFAGYMRDKGWSVSGVEIDPEAARLASERIGQTVHSPDVWVPEQGSQDLITLWHVLEHLPDPEARLRDFYHALRPGGHLLIAVPNTASRDRAQYHRHWAAWDVPIHLWHFQRVSLRALFERTGFESAGSEPMPFDAYYIALLSEQNRKNPLWWFSGVWHGWRSTVHARKTGEGSSVIWWARKPETGV